MRLTLTSYQAELLGRLAEGECELYRRAWGWCLQRRGRHAEQIDGRQARGLVLRGLVAEAATGGYAVTASGVEAWSRHPVRM